MYEKIWNIIYPKCCLVCFDILDDQNTWVCPVCQKKIKFVKQPYCYQCGKPLNQKEQEYCLDCSRHKHFFDQGFSLVEYDRCSAPSVLAIKYKNRRDFLDFYGVLAAQKYGKLLKERKIECIIPVPISRKKYRSRGYNQAEVFAEELEKRLDLPLKKKLLIRVKETSPLKNLTPLQRKMELEQAFAWTGKGYQGEKTVLLVDDIYTSGATVDACARILKKHGIKKVYVLTIAIGRGNE